MTDDNNDETPEGPDMIVPVPPGFAAWAAQIMGGGHQHQAPSEDQRLMHGEANELRIRNFIEGLGDDQVETLRSLVHMLAAEGTANYTTFYIEGILTADLWRRKPITADVLDEASK